jgi:hypothetical protein
MALVEACPDVLYWRDWCGNTPLALADRMDHRLGDVHPEVVELLELAEEVLILGSEPTEPENYDETRNTIDERKQRAKDILMQFQSIGWQAGIVMALSHNNRLFSLLSIPTSAMPELMSLICSTSAIAAFNSEATHATNTSDINSRNRLNGLFSLLRYHPLEI